MGNTEVLPKSSPTPPPPPESPPPPPHESTPPLAVEELTEESHPPFEPTDSQEIVSESPIDNVDSSTEDASVITRCDKNDKSPAPNLFYTPDEEENEVEVSPHEPVFEETECVSYVPPFNNPIYPNDNFTSYTSAIGKYTVKSLLFLLKHFNYHQLPTVIAYPKIWNSEVSD